LPPDPTAGKLDTHGCQATNITTLPHLIGTSRPRIPFESRRCVEVLLFTTGLQWFGRVWTDETGKTRDLFGANYENKMFGSAFANKKRKSCVKNMHTEDAGTRGKDLEPRVAVDSTIDLAMDGLPR